MFKKGLIGFILLCCPLTLWAQQIAFLPPGVLRVDAGQETKQSSRAYKNKNNTIALKNKEARRQNIIDSHVSGDLYYQEVNRRVTLEVGVFEDWSLGLAKTNRTLERQSTLKLEDPNDLDAANFVANNSSHQVQGAGDTEFWTWWRGYYDDTHLWLYGLNLNLNDGETGYNQAHPLNLGDGLNQVEFKLLWEAYLSGSRMMFRSQANLSVPLNAKVKNSKGNEVVLYKGIGRHIDSAFINQFGYAHYGLMLEGTQQPVTFLDKVGQNDSFSLVNLQFILGASDLKLLEEGPLALPILFELRSTHCLYGNNANLQDGLSLRFEAYF